LKKRNHGLRLMNPLIALARVETANVSIIFITAQTKSGVTKENQRFSHLTRDAIRWKAIIFYRETKKTL